MKGTKPSKTARASSGEKRPVFRHKCAQCSQNSVATLVVGRKYSPTKSGMYWICPSGHREESQ